MSKNQKPYRKRSIRIWVNKQEQKFLKDLRNGYIEGSDEHESLLHEEINRVGIGYDSIKRYWYKSQQFSIEAIPTHKSISDIRKDIIAEMDEYSPVYPKITRKKKSDGHLFVIDIADLHINKYASAKLTGAEYNSEIAVERAIKGTEALLEKVKGFDIEKILFIVGNDVLNTDSIFKTTTSGTPQDTDVHWWEAFLIARRCYVKCIETCLQYANVDVIHCPSNHDLMSGCFLADSLQSWFRKNKNVKFDVSPKYRKYYQYFDNMLEFEHGDKGKMDTVPLIMAQEEPSMWANTKFRYAYLHHLHHQIKHQFKSGKDFVGVNVTYLRSPSNADLWHAEKQFKSQVAVEGFVHSKHDGRIAHITHYFK